MMAPPTYGAPPPMPSGHAMGGDRHGGPPQQQQAPFHHRQQQQHQRPPPPHHPSVPPPNHHQNRGGGGDHRRGGDQRMMFSHDDGGGDPQQQQQQQHHHTKPPPSQPPSQQSQSSPPLTLRIILSTDEVSYLFGFDGVLIQQLRQQTGANLSLTDPVAPEHVLSINGTVELIFKAFSLICRKLWDFLGSIAPPGQQQPLNLRLVVPVSQCGSIIGKHGAKVKEIRDLTGANIQVSQENLPDSTERTVDISGTGESVLQCTYHICVVLQDAPVRGEVVPYVPKAGSDVARGTGKNAYKPVFLCGDKAYIIEGNMARPAPPDLLRKELAQTSLGEMAESLASLKNPLAPSPQQQQQQQQQRQPDYMNPLALMQAISTQQGTARGSDDQETCREFHIRSDMVGVIVGKGGAKVAEIRRISRANIHVPQPNERTADGEMVLTLNGSEEAILLAQFLIQSNIDMATKERERQRLQQQQHHNGGGGEGGIPGLPPPEALKNNPEAMSALNQINDMMQQPQHHGPSRYHHGGDNNGRGGGRGGGGGPRNFDRPGPYNRGGGGGGGGGWGGPQRGRRGGGPNRR